MAESRDSEDIFWVDPPLRGILPLDNFHCARSLAKRIRTGRYTPAINTAFDRVIKGCAARPETWLNAQLFKAYRSLHSEGIAHAVECWEGEKLIGGVYGVALGGAFFAESKFHTKPDASKMALFWLIQHLRSCGFTLLDVQFVTPHLERLGAQEITRAEYHQKLRLALAQRVIFKNDIQDVLGGLGLK